MCGFAQFSDKQGRAKPSAPNASRGDLSSAVLNEYMYIKKLDTADPHVLDIGSSNSIVIAWLMLVMHACSVCYLPTITSFLFNHVAFG